MAMFDESWWFIFGEYECGCVDIADKHGDVLQHVDREVAEVIVEKHNLGL
jgi:hypothetical protein